MKYTLKMPLNWTKGTVIQGNNWGLYRWYFDTMKFNFWRGSAVRMALCRQMFLCNIATPFDSIPQCFVWIAILKQFWSISLSLTLLMTCWWPFLNMVSPSSTLFFSRTLFPYCAESVQLITATNTPWAYRNLITAFFCTSVKQGGHFYPVLLWWGC